MQQINTCPEDRAFGWVELLRYLSPHACFLIDTLFVYYKFWRHWQPIRPLYNDEGREGLLMRHGIKVLVIELEKVAVNPEGQRSREPFGCRSQKRASATTPIACGRIEAEEGFHRKSRYECQKTETWWSFDHGSTSYA